jgi:hypothetical protein
MANAKAADLAVSSPHGDARWTSAKRQGGPDPPATKVGVSFLRRLKTMTPKRLAKLPNVPRQTLKDIPRPPNSASRDD